MVIPNLSEADIPVIQHTKHTDMQNIKMDWVNLYDGLYNLNIWSEIENM